MTTVAGPAEHLGAPRLTALLRSELLRTRSRRSLFWLPLLAVLAVLGLSTVMWFSTGQVTQADYDSAVSQFMADQQQYYDECMTQPEAASDPNWCWMPTEQDARDNAFWNLHRQPMGAGEVTGLIALAGGIGLLVALLLAATTGGADWGARTMGLVLSWEPRRTRLFLVRLLVIVVVTVLVEAVLVAMAFGIGSAIAGAHGVDDGLLGQIQGSYQPLVPSDAWQFAQRWLPLTALAAAGSFAVAMIARSTGWAIGASIGFVAVVESVLQLVWPWGSQWLVQTNIMAWLQGGTDVMVNRAAAQQDLGYGAVMESPAGYIHLSDTRALTTLAVVALTAVLIGWIAFRLRDVE